MSQKVEKDGVVVGAKSFTNVVENALLYDTCLIASNVATLSYPTGYFASYAAVGAANDIPFFNVRNRNSGLAYNNQDTRDQMSFAMKIFSIGVQWFGPSTALYGDAEGSPYPQRVSEQTIWMTEIPKHTSIEFQTNQDIRFKANSLMAPSGMGTIGGGVAQGSTLDSPTAIPSPNVAKMNWTQGTPMLTNRWGFRNPIEIPRNANISVRLRITEYGRTLLQNMVGPTFQPFQDVANNGDYIFKPAYCGVRCVLNGQRFVQQRGQAHA